MNRHTAPRIFAITASLSLALAASHAFAVLRYVDDDSLTPIPPYTNEANAAFSIQDAVNVSSIGDEILVKAGTYLYGGGCYMTANVTNRVYANIPILIRSEYGPAATMIAGGPGYRCVLLRGGATLCGFTLMNGTANQGWDTFYDHSGGGAILDGSTMLSNCIVTGCTAQRFGGGVELIGGGATSRMDNCTVTGNTAGESGGGVLVLGGEVSRCVITSNNAPSGGGVDLNGGLVQDSEINFNTASARGGGMLIYYGVSDYNYVCNNTCTDRGGGIYASGGLVSLTGATNNRALFGGGMACTGEAMIANCTGLRDIAYNSAQRGGGVYLEGGGTVSNSAICFNTASEYGGGARVTGGKLVTSSVYLNLCSNIGGGISMYDMGMVTRCWIQWNRALQQSGGVDIDEPDSFTDCLLLNSVVTSNSAVALGGGVNCYYGGIVQNCTITKNTSLDPAGIRCYLGGSVYNSIVYYNNGADFGSFGAGDSWTCDYSCVSTDVGAPHNTMADPMFTSYALDNYVLQGVSPCINTGSNMPWMVGEVDMNGNQRILFDIVDMGAYESDVPEPAAAAAAIIVCCGLVVRLRRG